MIDMRHKPRHLPQISAPYTHVVDKLNDDGVENELIDIDPEELKPSQGIVFGDEVGDFDDKEINPIFISKDNEVIDGHHRWVKKLKDQQPIKCVKVHLNSKDCARVLNKIQDIFEYEEQRKMEEVVTQDTINYENQKDSGVSDNEFFRSIEEDENPEGNEVTIIAYRQNPIMENSIIGNFFILKPVDGYDKYEIEFENLLNTSDIGVNCKEGELPVDTLSKVWFPNVDFDKLSEKHNTTPINLKNKAIAERAQKLGYDGIKYGDTMVQGLK